MTDLLKSQVMELTADNAKLNQVRSALLQLSIIAHHLDERRGQRDANNVQEDNSPKEDVDGISTPKAKNTTCIIKLAVDQSAKTSTRNKAGFEQLQQQKRDATNTQSISTTLTWIKFDIMGKTGVKLPSLALVDLEVDKNFMSYGTWVLFGHPILDQAQKTIQSCGKSSGEFLGLVNSSININSQLLEGEFFVMTPKHLQVDLVLGRQLAKIALDLQRPQAAHDKGLYLMHKLRRTTNCKLKQARCVQGQV